MIQIGKKTIRNFGKPYIIAEIGANHNGDLALAKKLIEAAKKAGCDFAKFQSWSKKSIFSKKVYQDNYFLKDDYRNRTDYSLEEIVAKFGFSEDQFRALNKYCKELKIEFLCTPFSFREVDFLVDDLKVNCVKIASMDVNNYPFLDYIAKKGLPIILSTGLSTLDEIDQAVRTIENAGNRQLIILHCVSLYPTPDDKVNLNNMDMLRGNYPEYPIGFSDHTLGTAIPLAAVAKGACLIEKHFTLDRNAFGWDHKISTLPDEMAQIVDGSRRIHRALGSFRRSVSEDERNNILSYRRSIIAAKRITEGEEITQDHLTTKRPGSGIEPRFLPLIVGRRARRNVEADELLQLDDF